VAEARGFDFPFRQDTEGFPQPATALSLVGAQIRQVLMTQLGERLMRPTFGSKLQEYVFETIDVITVEAVRAEVARALAESDVDVLVLGIRVTVEGLHSSSAPTALVVSIDFDQLGKRDSVGIKLTQGGEITVIDSSSQEGVV